VASSPDSTDEGRSDLLAEESAACVFDVMLNLKMGTAIVNWLSRRWALSRSGIRGG